MATGDITSCQILASPTHKRGWVASLRIEGWSGKTLASMNFGWTQPDGTRGNDPNTDTPSVVFSLTSPGYTVTAGDVETTTRARTVWGTSRIRKPHPDHAQFETTVVDSDLLVEVSLNDPIYTGDTAVTVSVLAATFVATDASESNAASGLSVTNNSDRPYPKVKAFWVDQALVGATTTNGNPVGGTVVSHINATRIGGTYRGIVSADQEWGIAACRYTLSDESENTAEDVQETPGPLWCARKGGDLDAMYGYVADLDTTGLDQGELGEARVRIYPLIGDADSVFDSDVFDTAGGEAHLRTRSHRIDHTGAYPEVFVYVDTANGDNDTGVASETAATARAAPYADMWAALLGARNYINTTYSRSNSLDGVRCRFMQNGTDPQDFGFGRTGFTGNMTAPGAAPILEPDPENTARVRLRTALASRNILCNRILFHQMPIEPESGVQSNYMAGVNTDDWYVFDRCELISESSSASAPIFNANVTRGSFVSCEYKDFKTPPRPNHLVWTEFTGTYQANINNASCLVGSRFLNTDLPSAVGYGTAVSNRVFGFCRVVSTAGPAYATDDFTNVWNPNLILIRPSSSVSSQPLFRAASKSYLDVLMRHISIVGQRMDGPQQEVAGNVCLNWCMDCSAGRYIGPKSDIFEGDGLVVNGWDTQWCVSWRNNYNGRSNTFPFEFDGIHNFSYRPGSDFAMVDADTDQTPTVDSEVAGLLRAGTVFSPRFDLRGRAVPNDGTGFAGALQGPLSVIVDGTGQGEADGTIRMIFTRDSGLWGDTITVDNSKITEISQVTGGTRSFTVGSVIGAGGGTLQVIITPSPLAYSTASGGALTVTIDEGWLTDENGDTTAAFSGIADGDNSSTQEPAPPAPPAPLRLTRGRGGGSVSQKFTVRVQK